METEIENQSMDREGKRLDGDGGFVNKKQQIQSMATPSCLLASYWLSFFLLRLPSVELGLRMAYLELHTHSRSPFEEAGGVEGVAFVSLVEEVMGMLVEIYESILVREKDETKSNEACSSTFSPLPLSLKILQKIREKICLDDGVAGIDRIDRDGSRDEVRVRNQNVEDFQSKEIKAETAMLIRLHKIFSLTPSILKLCPF